VVIMASDLNNLATLLNDVAKREKERNEILKDIGFSDFALSDEGLIDETIKVFNVRFKQILNEKILESISL
tara:strand:+ start:1331 stop:1543 length:213 start_codon:yes stop_codon:yes gene_type:complete